MRDTFAFHGPVKHGYWTTDKGTRHEARHRRCGSCGETETRRVGDRFGSCWKCGYGRSYRA